MRGVRARGLRPATWRLPGARGQHANASLGAGSTAPRARVLPVGHGGRDRARGSKMTRPSAATSFQKHLVPFVWFRSAHCARAREPQGVIGHASTPDRLLQTHAPSSRTAGP